MAGPTDDFWRHEGATGGQRPKDDGFSYNQNEKAWDAFRQGQEQRRFEEKLKDWEKSWNNNSGPSF